MKVTVLTLFPEILEGFFSTSIMARAVKEGKIAYQLVDFREYSTDKHKKCDDAPYGGGAGMVLKAEPLSAALDAQEAKSKHVVYLTPSGSLFNQAKAVQYSKTSELVLICGRYEGVDQRIIDEYVDDEVSIGDYVLSSGETAALVVIDAVYRLVEGVINGESLVEESHTDGLLEYPHYTRPENFHSVGVPTELLSGNHAAIERWRFDRRLEKTLRNRPELLDRAVLSKERRSVLDCLLLSQGGQDGSCKGDYRRPVEGQSS